MPVLTSLYLCNRTVYAAVGVPAANGARVTAACQTELPEGCLINGIITNEGELTAALQGFFAANSLPTQRVALAAGGSQFNHRVLTLPRMNEKKRAAVLTRELSSGGADVTAPLDDYMLLSTDKKSKADTVLATRVESAVIENYIHLATACGLKLHSIDLALAGHTHGGQVSLFHRWSPARFSHYGHRFLTGLRHNSAGIPIIISNGLGTSRKDIRLFTPSEVVLIVLHRR